MLFGLKKEWNTDASYSVERPRRCYAKWNKPEVTGVLKFLAIENKIVVVWSKEEDGIGSYI